MLNSTLAALASAIVTVIATAGYVGIAVLMALESACIPLPSEVIMPFAGYLLSTRAAQREITNPKVRSLIIHS